MTGNSKNMALQRLSGLSFLMLLFVLGCTTTNLEYDVKRKTASDEAWVDTLPKSKPLPSSASALQKYLNYLKLDSAGEKKVKARLEFSQLQFLNCEDLNDWSCLEKASSVSAPYRKETNSSLGDVVRVNDSFKMQHYFTYKWYEYRKQKKKDTGLLDNQGQPSEDFQTIPSQPPLAEILGGIINQPWSGASIAIYGIDGIGDIDESSKEKEANYSVMSVFNGIKRIPNVRSVVDVEPAIKFTVVNGKVKKVGNQYSGTQSYVDYLNQNQNTVRIEFPIAKIMHNKFFVFEKDNQATAVWTGTANITKNCMGDENFANMAVYIRNKEIAEVFKSEFDEMYNTGPVVKGQPFPVGRFHLNKKPNTKRYFQFNDGTEVKVHFSPTDDGEHRSILPMILSAEKGDELRISMFVGAGTETARAIQLAAARGAKVRVFQDMTSNNQISSSWSNKKANPGLLQQNPYFNGNADLEVRLTNWAGGAFNHQKVATLTKKTNSGMRAEVLIVGSQNWTDPGNDENDENMLTIRNRNQGLQAAKDFNDHFDRFLWPTGKPALLK